MGKGGEGVREKGEGVGGNELLLFFRPRLHAVLFPLHAFLMMPAMQANPLSASISHFLTLLLNNKIWGSKC